MITPIRRFGVLRGVQRRLSGSRSLARSIAHPQSVAPLRLAPGERVVLIIAYSSEGSSRMEVSVETAESFTALTERVNAYAYVFYGMIFVLLAVTSIAVVVLRQALHLVYGGYVVSLFLYIAHFDGNAFRYVWPDQPGFNNIASVVAGSAVMVFGSLFAILFLQTARYHRIMHRILQGLLATVLGMTAVLWVANPQLLKQLLVIMISVSALIWLSSAIVSAQKGRVLFGLRRHGAGWRIEIHDTGPGLGPDDFAEALTRSARLPRDQDEAEGSGLGLAIVRQIATAQSWRLSACRRRCTGASIRLDIQQTA